MSIKNIDSLFDKMVDSFDELMESFYDYSSSQNYVNKKKLLDKIKKFSYDKNMFARSVRDRKYKKEEPTKK